MNRESRVKEGNRVIALKLFVVAMGWGVCSTVSAQNIPPKPANISDLLISSLSAKFIAPNKVQYSWTISNVGTGLVILDGPTAANSDNLKVQAMVSKDTVF